MGFDRPAPRSERAHLRAIPGGRASGTERETRRSWPRKLWLSIAFAAGVFGLAAVGWQLGHERAGSRPMPAARVRVERTSLGEVWLRDRDGARRAIERELMAGDGLETGAGEAQLGFPSGATAQLAERSRVEVMRAGEGEGLFLAAGAVEVEVLKARSGQFSVQTPDALVVVHGTHFSVSLEPGAGATHTRVDVSRGLVAVESQGQQVWLSAGQHWPAEAAHATPVALPAPEAPAAPSGEEPAAGGSAPMPHAVAPAATDGVATDGAATDGAATAAPDHDAGTVDAIDPRPPARNATPTSIAVRKQNRSFARAMELKKRDEPAAALAELERLQRKHPRSVLKQEIRVEHFRLLAQLGRGREAAREARAYLAAYPHGSARREARKLATGAE